MFYFDTFYDFIMMGKHGFYVWLCFGVVLFVWMVLLFSARQENKKQLKHGIIKAKNSKYKAHARRKNNHNKQNQTTAKPNNLNKPQTQNTNAKPNFNKGQTTQKTAQNSTRKTINNKINNNAPN